MRGPEQRRRAILGPLIDVDVLVNPGANRLMVLVLGRLDQLEIAGCSRSAGHHRESREQRSRKDHLLASVAHAALHFQSVRKAVRFITFPEIVN